MLYLYESTFQITYLSFFQLLKPESLLCEVDTIHTLVSGETRWWGSGWDRSETGALPEVAHIVDRGQHVNRGDIMSIG